MKRESDYPAQTLYPKRSALTGRFGPCTLGASKVSILVSMLLGQCRKAVEGCLENRGEERPAWQEDARWISMDVQPDRPE